jgi:uncharacterized membrane protein
MHDTELNKKNIILLLSFFIFIYVCVYSYFVIYRHIHFNSSLFDLGIQDQVVWNTSNGKWFVSSIEVDNYLGDHVQPLMIILAPLYKIYPSVYWLLIFQTIVLALGAIPVFLFASRHLNSSMAGLIFAIAYLTYPSIGSINRFDFHWEATVIPIFMMAINLIDSGRLISGSVWLFLATLGKEEIGLTVAAFGFYLIIIKKRYKFGFFWLIIGTLYSFLALFYLIPAFRGAPSDTIARYSWLGDGFWEIMHTMIFNPNYVFNNLVWYDIKRYFPLLFGPLSFLSLLSPTSLIPMIPSVLYNLLSSAHTQRTIFFQYVAPIVPFVFMSAIYGAKNAIKLIGTKTPMKVTFYVVILFVSLLSFSRTAPIFVSMDWQKLHNENAVYKALSYIPQDASVITTGAYAAHLAHRDHIKLPVDLSLLCEVDFIFFNTQDFRPFNSFREYGYEEAVKKAMSCGYEEVFSFDGVILLKSPSYSYHPK